MNIAFNMTKLVGKTPLVYLNTISKDLPGTVAVKLENFNPLSSVKDRIGLAMIEDAEKNGILKKGTVIVEATSGNTGIALAYIGAAKGYKVILTMPDSMSRERQQLLRFLGAELILTPGEKGMKGAVEKADSVTESLPSAFRPSQFDNPANPRIHYDTTAKEIWDDTDGSVDIFVAGVGTGGTFSGVSKRLKELKSGVKTYALEPKDSAVLSGNESGPHKIQGIGAGFIPENMDLSLADGVITVSNEDAGEMSRRLAREEGILAGLSSGANVTGALQLASKEENRGKLIVTIICDTGERYLSTWLFSDT